MFGYVVVNRQELKLRELELYQSYYCGFCEELKERYGFSGQMTLSYDMTFLILLLKGLYEAEDTAKEGRCILHPVKKHISRRNSYTAYAADMNIILSRYHCMDDWEDEHRITKRACAAALKRAFDRAQAAYPQKAEVIRRELERLGAYEKAGETDLDRVSGCFGSIMAEIFACRADEWEEELGTMGFFLGKFIYLMDAYEDVEKDRKNGCYNPLASRYGEDGFEEEAYQILRMMMAECSRAFERLPIVENAEILRNILYSGVWCRYEMVRGRRKEQQENA